MTSKPFTYPFFSSRYQFFDHAITKWTMPVSLRYAGVYNKGFLDQLCSGFVLRHYWHSKSRTERSHLALTETLQVTSLPFSRPLTSLHQKVITVWEKVKWKFSSVNRAVKSHRVESQNTAAQTLPWKATPLITHLHCTTCERHAHFKLNEVCFQRCYFSTQHSPFK